MRYLWYPIDIFDIIAEAVKKNHKIVKCAIVDSFTLYMILKKRRSHHVSIEEIRPIFTTSKSLRKDKDIKYFFDILATAKLICYEPEDKKWEIIHYRICELDKDREFIRIVPYNSYLYEQFRSNVPYAMFCLVRCCQTYDEYGRVSVFARQSHKWIANELGIGISTVEVYKELLISKGYLKMINKYNKRNICSIGCYYTINHNPYKKKRDLSTKEKTKAKKSALYNDDGDFSDDNEENKYYYERKYRRYIEEDDEY